MRKYRIDELMRELPYSKAKLCFSWLPKELGVTPKTFRSWRKLEINSTGSIPGEKLFQLASFLGVQPQELFTIAPEPITVKKPEFNAAKINSL